MALNSDTSGLKKKRGHWMELRWFKVETWRFREISLFNQWRILVSLFWYSGLFLLQYDQATSIECSVTNLDYLVCDYLLNTKPTLHLISDSSAECWHWNFSAVSFASNTEHIILRASHHIVIWIHWLNCNLEYKQKRIHKHLCERLYLLNRLLAL